ncbi:MAG: hypothetical protein SCK29_05555 [Bacillota bacterium]|nr:hypothetical protein [Bacillota bacterium]MDW7683570.1 hypothetical protein [Bacillota bacterium]
MPGADIIIIILLGIIAWNVKTGFESLQDQLTQLNKSLGKIND